MTPEKTEDPLRKSLEGLSPQQDAKVATLKQMFQDHDEEVLCSILFDENSGNIDASIEHILRMQAKENQEVEDADKTEENPGEDGVTIKP
mmetsp:Transcript_22368/g.34628  ORF Transcript_22368/g.34628 Transcript_22368/m.34628 type:complete len:90 (+) Transcript_22368:41-310(+)